MHIKRREVAIDVPALSHLPQVLQRVLAARGITEPSLLEHQLSSLLSFDTLMNVDKAAARLEEALRLDQRILIVGDFDADGATSTALAISALRAMGAKQVDFLVPNRFEFGYGLTRGIIEVAVPWKPHLVITVDNGISSIDGVKAANEAGMDVLVTDHHLPGEELPDAVAIVNPNQVGDPFPSKAMAGVGVIFYVMLALRRLLVNSGWFKISGHPEPNMSQYLDLVALGTVADVVPLDHNNRILVSQGVARIRSGRARPGIRALLDVAGKRDVLVRERDLGFAVAPRLNAAGRLDDMSLGITCLLAEQFDEATQYAEELDALNVERRKIEADMKEQAMQALEGLSKTVSGQENMPVVLCLFDKSWHQGVIGILAGRLKERFHRPVFAFAAVGDSELKGSARSIQGLNIRDVLAAVDKDHPELISKFGGHAMAAGLSLHPERFPAFQEALLAEVSKHLSVEHCTGECWTDGALEASDFSLSLAEALQNAGPWGQQCPEPQFDNVFEVLDQRLLKQQHLKLTLMPLQGDTPVEGIAFYVDTNAWPNNRARYVHAAYTLDINHFRGKRTLQLIISTIVAVSETSTDVEQHQLNQESQVYV